MPTKIDFENKLITVDGYTLPLTETSDTYRAIVISGNEHKAETWDGKQTKIAGLVATVQKIIDAFNLEKIEREKPKPIEPTLPTMEDRLTLLEARVAGLESQKG